MTKETPSEEKEKKFTNNKEKKKKRCNKVGQVV